MKSQFQKVWFARYALPVHLSAILISSHRFSSHSLSFPCLQSWDLHTPARSGLTAPPPWSMTSFLFFSKCFCIYDKCSQPHLSHLDNDRSLQLLRASHVCIQDPDIRATSQELPGFPWELSQQQGFPGCWIQRDLWHCCHLFKIQGKWRCIPFSLEIRILFTCLYFVEGQLTPSILQSLP